MYVKDLAERLYIDHIDLNKPLRFKELVQQCMQAAEIFAQETSNKHIANKTDQSDDYAYGFVLKAIRDKKKIIAIKELRAIRGYELKKAKDIIDELWWIVVGNRAALHDNDLLRAHLAKVIREYE